MMLRLVLPKGSLERATLELFAAADLSVTRSSEVDYRASIDDPRVAEVRILRPQEIPLYVADGLFDVGITGRDWVEERGSAVTSLGVLPYSKATGNPVRVVLAVPTDSPVTSVADLAHSATGPDGAVRVSTEYPELTRRYLEGHGVKADVSLSYGATEAKVPDIADCVVEITETGQGAAGGRAQDRGDAAGLAHRVDRQPGGRRGLGQASRHGTAADPVAGGARGPRQGAGEAQRPGRAPARGDRGPALAAVARPSRSCSAGEASPWRPSCPSRRSTC